jgi:transcriptional antiterminator NusG
VKTSLWGAIDVSDETDKVIEQPEPEAGASAPVATVADVSSALPDSAPASDEAAAPGEPVAVAEPSDEAEPGDTPEDETAAEDAAAGPSDEAADEGGSGGDDSGDGGDGEQDDSDDEEASAKDWYILKVQSNRETTIADALRRRIKIEGLEDLFGEVIVPTEMVTEFKSGKKRVVKRKLYPGYIVVHMEVTDDTWFLVRDTPGIGDFTGSGGKPIPMQPHEVDRIIQREDEDSEDTPKLKIAFKNGDRVKVKEGNFESFEGEVDTIDETNGHVTVMINIFGRSTPVELEYWQIENV